VAVAGDDLWQRSVAGPQRDCCAGDRAVMRTHDSLDKNGTNTGVSLWNLLYEWGESEAGARLRIRTQADVCLRLRTGSRRV